MDPQHTPTKIQAQSSPIQIQSGSSACLKPTPQWHQFLPNPDHLPGPSNNWRSQLRTYTGWTWECIDTLCWCQSDPSSCNCTTEKTSVCKRNATAVGGFCENCKDAKCPILSQEFCKKLKDKDERYIEALLQRQRENPTSKMSKDQERYVLQVIRMKAWKQQKEKVESERAQIEKAQIERAAKEAREREEEANAAFEDDSDSDWTPSGE